MSIRKLKVETEDKSKPEEQTRRQKQKLSNLG